MSTEVKAMHEFIKMCEKLNIGYEKINRPDGSIFIVIKDKKGKDKSVFIFENEKYVDTFAMCI